MTKPTQHYAIVNTIPLPLFTNSSLLYQPTTHPPLLTSPSISHQITPSGYTTYTLPATYPQTSDSEDDTDECALSEQWSFQRQSRRWSRKDGFDDYSDDANNAANNNTASAAVLTSMSSDLGVDTDNDVGSAAARRRRCTVSCWDSGRVGGWEWGKERERVGGWLWYCYVYFTFS